jgi:catechol 2,3-dioxygenase-like lactoylglutathione lyase family enzyme
MRVARPTADLDRIRTFYADVVGLPLLWSFADHDGFDGAIFGLPDERAQLELVRTPHDDTPAPTNEDVLVLYHGAGEPSPSSSIVFGGPEASRWPTTTRC